MNNIEKLAIEHGAKINESHDVIFDTDFDKTGVMCLKAFAKALQSSEPVAEVIFDKNKNRKVFDWLVEDVQKLEIGTLLFTLPPSTVPLEKYNKLLDALKEIASVLPDEHWTLDKAKQAIAEAELSEGKEG